LGGDLQSPPGPVDLGGFRLTDDPPAGSLRLPAGRLHPLAGVPRGRRGVERPRLSALEVRLFLLAPDGRALGGLLRQGSPRGARGMPWSQARFPDGGPLDWVTTTPTREAQNEVGRIETVVLNEIFYHPPRIAGVSSSSSTTGRGGRGPLGISLRQGDRLPFPGGDRDPPGRVPRRDGGPGPPRGGLWARGSAGALHGPPLEPRRAHPAGRLLGNPVDDIRYHQGGGWSRWADGGGSSLELIDPRRMTLRLGLGRERRVGQVLLGELRLRRELRPLGRVGAAHLPRRPRRVPDRRPLIVRGAGANIISNPGFEASTASWTIEGTHGASRRTTADKSSGTACLELTATGKGDTLVNRIETETSPAMTTGAYTVSLMARWLRDRASSSSTGSSRRSPRRKADPATNLSGTRWGKAATHDPRALGTPGGENGSTRRLREPAPSTSAPRSIREPRARRPARHAGRDGHRRVADADGVPCPRVLPAGERAGSFTVVTLLDDGLHGDGAAAMASSAAPSRRSRWDPDRLLHRCHR